MVPTAASVMVKSLDRHLIMTIITRVADNAVLNGVFNSGSTKSVR
jgi:hypothetical protein